MAQFKDLAHLQRYLEKNASKILNDKGIESILAKTMSQAVYDVVYGHYIPVEYKRRRNEGGLSDVRNMHITKVEVKNGKVTILFENLTQGQTHYTPIYTYDRDSMYGKFIADTIEEGIEDNWYETGKWSEARPFVQETIKRIHQNPSYLINAIKNAYRKAGFNVK